MEKTTEGSETSDAYILLRRKRIYTWLQRFTRMTVLLSISILIFIISREGEGFHEKQITRPAELPRPFFPSHSHVKDFMFGSLQPVIKLLEDEEIIFAMYYAPWCAESKLVRGEFISAAKVLSNTVKFVAINCWYPSGECRQRMKFISYPELFVYHTGVLDGYRFTGIKEAEYFVKFAESFLHPLQPLYTEQQLNEFTVQSDNTVIGYFDFNSSPQPPGFHQFYLASLRIMSYDFYQPVRFGLLQSAVLAKALNLTVPGRFILTRVGNVTLKYPIFYNMTCGNITSWVITHKQKSLVPWLVPPGIKSLTLSVPMQQGPAVFVFGPSNPIVNFNPFLDMVKLASLDVMSCGNHSRYFKNVLRVYLENSVAQLNRAKNLNHKCLSRKPFSISSSFQSSSSSKCCVSLSSSSSRHVSPKSVCEYCVQRPTRDSGFICDIDISTGVGSEWPVGLVNSCSDFYQFYNVNEHHSMCCKEGASTPPFLYRQQSSGSGRRITDPFVINYENNEIKNVLDKVTLQKSKHLPTLEEMSAYLTTASDIRSGNISGYQCRTNKTVSFYYLDSVYHSAFMKKFNVHVPKQSSRLSVILVDLKDEAVYVMKEKLNYRNLAKFIQNYSKGGLTRYRQSSMVSTATECVTDVDSVCIQEVNAENFLEVVMDNSKDVMLLFYSHWCGYCSQMSSTYVAVASHFKDSKDIVFARINADLNDLPWEYTVERFPSIIFFPAQRKSNSILFPENIAKTKPNLIKFVLHYSNFSLQVDEAVKLCSSQCVKTNSARILQRIQDLEKSISALERSSVTIATQKPANDNHRNYLEISRSALRVAIHRKNLKLRKAQILNHYLQKNWTKLDKKIMFDLIAEHHNM